MTIFLTGASGLLGHALAKAFLRKGWGVHGTVNQLPVQMDGLRIHNLDLSTSGELTNTLSNIGPQVIVNAAALSVPATCQIHPQLSHALNVILPNELARYAAQEGIHLIHYSTDMVFDGKSGNYSENDSTHPKNLYGEHKLESEKRVQDISPNTSVVIRLPLLTGNSLSGKRSMHEALWLSWKIGESTKHFEDEWRQPVSVSNVADLTVELIQNPDIHGLFHWAGADQLNRWELGQHIARKLGVPDDLLQKTLSADFPEFKDRPKNLTLDCSKLKARVQTEPAPFKDQLVEMVVPNP
ncbi:MAG: SDR family oxidoreductase [Verrucomicrobia bacterium]|nr:SDR family oxidoreductase [Verrucomicrobiota bacterium]